MKQYVHKVLALLLVCTMFSSVLLPVSAAEVDGTPAVDSEIASDVVATATRTKLFDITASSVKKQLRSDVSSKSFATYNHVGKEIQITGSLTHSDYKTIKYIEVGLCHHTAPSGAFEYVESQTFKSGTINYSADVDSLPTDSSYSNAQTYYVYIKNNASKGSISGNLSVYSA